MLWPRLARALIGKPLTDPAPPVPQDTVQALAERLAATARARLGRSLAIREVDSGSCNGCELEVTALQNVAYDLERFGLRSLRGGDGLVIGFDLLLLGHCLLAAEPVEPSRKDGATDAQQNVDKQRHVRSWRPAG